MFRWCLSVLAVISLASRDARAQGRTVPETEPNDSVRSANVVTFGDTVTGVMGTTSDWDYFAIDIPASTKVQLVIVRHTFNRMYGIAGPDGNSIGKDGGSDSPDTLNFLTTTAGRHIVYMTEYGSTGLGPPSNGEYAVRIGPYVTPPPGPGDPVTLVVGNLGLPNGIAAGPSGELYIVSDRGTGGPTLTRVARDGSSTVMATGLPFSGGIAINGAGD